MKTQTDMGRFNMMMPKRMIEALRKEASDLGISVSELIRRIVDARKG